VAGGVVRDRVSRQTDYLVVGEGAGSKLAEAERLRVRVIGLEEFLRLIGED
jgi:DNA ligase (NAD+)